MVAVEAALEHSLLAPIGDRDRVDVPRAARLIGMGHQVVAIVDPAEEVGLTVVLAGLGDDGPVI